MLFSTFFLEGQNNKFCVSLHTIYFLITMTVLLRQFRVRLVTRVN